MLKNFIRFCLKQLYPLFKKILTFQVYAYLAVGAANTIFNMLLFAVFYWLIAHSSDFYVLRFNLNLLAVELATIISFLISVYSGFWLSKNFAFTDAFNEKKENTKQFGKYFLVSLQGQFSDYLITKGLILVLQMNPMIAYFISTFIMLTINYFLQKYYTFRSRKVVTN